MLHHLVIFIDKSVIILIKILIISISFLLSWWIVFWILSSDKHVFEILDSVDGLGHKLDWLVWSMALLRSDFFFDRADHHHIVLAYLMFDSLLLNSGLCKVITACHWQILSIADDLWGTLCLQPATCFLFTRPIGMLVCFRTTLAFFDLVFFNLRESVVERSQQSLFFHLLYLSYPWVNLVHQLLMSHIIEVVLLTEGSRELCGWIVLEDCDAVFVAFANIDINI